MFKILAMDGGGIRGTYTAAVLDELQHRLKRPVNDYFDLVVGTSTGGIIALALANEMSTKEILSIYCDSGSEIFPHAKSGSKGLIDWIFSPKHDSRRLTDSLTAVFGSRKFMDSTENVAVTSFDAADASPVVFRSDYHKSMSTYGELSVVDVALATSAAPTYFSAAPAGTGFMIDGGVWANCPVMVGLTDAMSIFEKQRKEIRILSIGTTSEPVFVEKSALDGGLIDWAKPAAPTIMHASKLAALNQARRIAHSVLRIDTPVNRDRFKLDDASAINDLMQLGRSAADRHFDEFKKLFTSRLATHRPPLVE